MPASTSGKRYAVLLEQSSTVTSDLVAEIERGGGTCKVFPIRLSGQSVSLENYASFADFLRDLLVFEPDALISINRKGTTGASAIVLACELLGIPILAWYMDNPLYIPIREWEKDLDSLVFLNFDRYYDEPLRAQGLRHVESLPVGTNPAHFQLPNHSRKKFASRPYPISFVGALGIHRMQQMLREIEAAMDGLYKHFAVEIQREVEAGGKWQQSNPDRMPFEYLDCLIEEGRPIAPFAADPPIRRLLAALIDFQATFTVRVEAVQRLLPLGLHVWGDDAWKLYVPADRFHGKVAWNEVQQIYAKSRLVLNITRYQIFHSFTQRFLDVPLCGGVLISDDRLKIDPWFTDGEDLILFKDADDLLARAEAALGDPETTAGIAERARSKVIEQHTYAHRVPELDAVVERATTRLTRRGEADFARQPGLIDLADAVFEQFIHSGDLESMRRLLEAARPANCDHPDWLAWRAALAFESGKSDEAVAFLNRVLVEDPNQRVARYYLALVMLQRGKPALAAETARKLSTDYPLCRRSRSLYERIGHLEKRRPQAPAAKIEQGSSAKIESAGRSAESSMRMAV